MLNAQPIRARVSRYLDRQSGNLSGAFLVFALIFAWNIGEAMYQGAGLHGYLIARGRSAGESSLIPVWNLVVADLVAFSASLVFFGMWLYFKRRKMPKRTLSDDANLQKRTLGH